VYLLCLEVSGLRSNLIWSKPGFVGDIFFYLCNCFWRNQLSLWSATLSLCVSLCALLYLISSLLLDLITFTKINYYHKLQQASIRSKRWTGAQVYWLIDSELIQKLINTLKWRLSSCEMLNVKPCFHIFPNINCDFDWYLSLWMYIWIKVKVFHDNHDNHNVKTFI